MPVHLADNDLGGSAIYDEKFNSNNRFMRGVFMEVQPSSTVEYVFPEKPAPFMGSWHPRELGWTITWGLLGSAAIESVTPYAGANVPYPYGSGGHINKRSLTSFTSGCATAGTCGGGTTVIAAIKAHGMILDLAHMGQLGREQVLGLGANATTSPLSQGCDLSIPFCQQSAYPAISSHAGLREMTPPADVMGNGTNEGGLTAAMIARIRAVGGTVGIGTTAADTKSASESAPGAWPNLFGQTVPNDCAGSSKTFAQSYLYALRRMNGKGITLGTDINGLEDRLNPRFGTQGCYARGNIPHSVMFAADASVMVSSASDVPINYRANIIALPGGTAGAQRLVESAAAGLNYVHYGSVPPRGGRFRTTFDPRDYQTNMANEQFSVAPYAILKTDSMATVSPLPPLTPSVTADRTFDLNYDGLAHYGMLPDMLQDARVVGITNEQLGPMFQGAEALVLTWEKACAFPGALCN